MKDQLAFPKLNNLWEENGLTKRELFAAMAMQGSLADGQIDAALNLILQQNSKSNYEQLIARLSVNLADALIAELEKGKNEL